MAVLVLLAATAGTGIVAADLRTLVADGADGTLGPRADGSSIGTAGIGLAAAILAVALLARLGLTLLYVLLGRCLGNLATHEHGNRLAVHDAYHLLEHVEGLGLVDHW